MSETWSTGEIFAAIVAVALIASAAQAFVGAMAARLRAHAATARALDALYLEITLNTRALERWRLEDARARRDGDRAVFAPRRAVFDGLGPLLHSLPKPALEKTLELYAAIATLERLTLRLAQEADPAASAGARRGLGAAVEAAAALGRAALFSFEIEGAVAAGERPRADAPARADGTPSDHEPATIARAA